MTHYLLSVHGPAEMDEFGSYGSKEEMEEAFAATGAFNDKLQADGYWVFAGGLQAASTATVVDGQGETPVMTDGPYLETKEVIGGFWVIDAPDLDVALKVDYVLRETGANLRRNLTLTAASLLTVVVSLILVGSALLMRQGVERVVRR